MVSEIWDTGKSPMTYLFLLRLQPLPQWLLTNTLYIILWGIFILLNDKNDFFFLATKPYKQTLLFGEKSLEYDRQYMVLYHNLINV